jgi:hypothetical protein
MDFVVFDGGEVVAFCSFDNTLTAENIAEKLGLRIKARGTLQSTRHVDDGGASHEEIYVEYVKMEDPALDKDRYARQSITNRVEAALGINQESFCL